MKSALGHSLFFGIYEAIVSDNEQIADLESATKLTESNYDEQRRDYRLGLVTNLDVLSAAQQFQENHRALDRARIALKFDLERYEVAAGRRPFKSNPPK